MLKLNIDGAAVTVRPFFKTLKIMKLITINSGSKGNCYLLQDTRGNCLMLEAGERLFDVKKALNFEITNIDARLVTHEHGDHAGHVADVLKTSIPVYCTEGTAKHIRTGRYKPQTVKCGEINSAGSFTFTAFHVRHDAEEPCGWLIYHEECGMVLFATDAERLDHNVNGISTFLIECNYDNDILIDNVKKGIVAPDRAVRVRRSHMSIEDCIAFLGRNIDQQAQRVILCHLSSQNSGENMAQTIHNIFSVPVFVAKAGVTIDL